MKVFDIESRRRYGGKFRFLLFITFALSLLPRYGAAQPAVLESGMTPNQSNWVFESPLDKVNKQAKFFMRVQRQGNLNQYGTFDFYFKVQVLRPDGSEVWNQRYGFD